MAMTAYTPTTSAAITNYMDVLVTAPAGVPRFDYGPVTGQALGLLIEEQRTNLALNSSNSKASAMLNGSFLPNIAIAPDGTQTACYAFLNSGIAYNINDGSGLSISSIAYTAQTYTWSVYAKAGALSILMFRNNWTGGNPQFNLLTGAVTQGSGTSSMTLIGNGWYRCVNTYTVTTSTNGISLRPYAATGNGDGISGVYLWGIQVEAGSFATSYVDTTTAQVTRNADSASMTGTNFSSWYNQAQGTVCVNYDFNATSGINANAGIFALNNSNTGNPLNRLDIRYNNPINTSNGIGLNAPNAGTMLTGGNVNRIGVSYNSPNSTYAFNGGSISNFSLTAMPIMTQLRIGAVDNGDAYMGGHIRKLTYYSVALSSAQLIGLTS